MKNSKKISFFSFAFSLIVLFNILFHIQKTIINDKIKADQTNDNITVQLKNINSINSINKNIVDIQMPYKIRDQRAIKLENYLKKQKTELYKYSDLIIELSDKYDINYKIPIAIAGVESGFCKINFKPNNCWGYGNYSWDNLEIAINEYYSLMNKYYFSKGKKTVETISAIYNPYPNEYTKKLNFFINQIP